MVIKNINNNKSLLEIKKIGEFMNQFNSEKIKKKLLIKYPYFGSVISGVPIIKVNHKEIDTAATNGKSIFHSESFMNSLNEDEQTFIIAHEVLHIAFEHIPRSKGKNKEIWNRATDAIINAHLVNDGLKIVGNGVNIPEAINYNAEELYEKMLGEMEVEKKDSKDLTETIETGEEGKSLGDSEELLIESKGGESQNKGDLKELGTVENHSIWEDALKEIEEEVERTHESQNTSEDSGSKNLSDINKQEDEDESKKDENNSIDENDAFKQNEEEKKKQFSKLMKELSNRALETGTSSTSQIRKVEGIGTRNPLVDWRKLLREATKRDIDWSYQNAEVEYGVISPKLERISIPETEIILDTSGSVSKVMLKNFLRECKNIFHRSKVRVGCFDTKFYGFKDIKNLTDIDNMEFRGGGGTNFNVAVNSFTRRVENKIIFTDGESSMPNQKVNAIWIVFGGKKINPPGGKVIEITDEQLKKLQMYKTKESEER